MKNKKKLLMCYHSSQYGGIEKQILDLIKTLNYDFDFIVACPKGPLVEQYVNAGAKHVELYPKNEIDFNYIIDIYKLCKSEAVDILHAHELLGTLSIFAGFLAGVKKRVYHVHTTFFEWKHEGLKKYLSIIPNFFVNYMIGNFIATDTLALTLSLKKIREEKEKILPEKITVIPNAVNLDDLAFDKEARSEIRNKYNIPQNALVLGCMSRFTEGKGQELLIKAFSKNKNGSYLLLAGGGKLLQKCRELSLTLNFDEKVIFTEHFEDKDKKGILSAMDISILPTYAEGFGIALIESMANGRAIIASDIPVLKEVAGDAITYFKCGDIEDLTGKINTMINENLNEWGKKSLERSKYFSMKNFSDAYRKLYLK